MTANMPPGHPVWIEDEGINFRYLIRDHNSKFTARFDEIFKGLSNAKEPIVQTGIRMTVMNSFTNHLSTGVRLTAISKLSVSITSSVSALSNLITLLHVIKVTITISDHTKEKELATGYLTPTGNRRHRRVK